MTMREQLARFLYASGLGHDEIAEVMGVSAQTIRRWIK